MSVPFMNLYQEGKSAEVNSSQEAKALVEMTREQLIADNGAQSGDGLQAHKVALDDEDALEEAEPVIKQEIIQDSEQLNLEIPEITSKEHVPTNPTFGYCNFEFFTSDPCAVDYKKYTYEFYYIFMFTFAVLFFMKGKGVNDLIATKWKRASNEVIASNFAHFGLTQEPNLALDKLSYNEYNYYASGRQNCLYALFKVELKKRQCIFNTLTMELIWTKNDTVTIEVPINVPEYYLPDGTSTTHLPLELMVCRKRDMKTVFNHFTYLKNCVGPIQMKNFKPENDSLVILAESEEAANHIFDNQVCDILSKMGDKNVMDIHFTDQKTYCNYPMWMKATLYIENNEDRYKEGARVLKLLFYMIDRAVTLRLSAANRQKAEKNRKAVEKMKAKEKEEEQSEQLLAKKREKEQKFVEKLKSLPPEQQRKLEEKKKEKEMNKQRKKMSKVMKF